MTISKAYAWMQQSSSRGKEHGGKNSIDEKLGTTPANRMKSACRPKPSWALALVLLSLFFVGCHKGGGSITVTILPSASPSVDEGQSYNFTATVANDTTNQGVAWTLNTSGCSGSACGMLSNAQPFSVTYTAPTGLSATESITLTAKSVNGGDTTTATISVVLPPEFTTGGTSGTTQLVCSGPCILGGGQNGVPYDQTITGTDGISPLTFSLQPGSSLPAGLALNQSGAIVGKPTNPTLGQSAATTAFTVLLTDNGLPPLSVSQQFSITVQPPPALSIPTSGALSVGFINGQYSSKVSASGGTTPLTWNLAPGSGSLPPGLALNSTSGQITGIPTIQTGVTYPMTYSFKVQATDSSIPAQTATSGTLSITVQQPAPLAISTPSLLSVGTSGTPYTASLLAAGGIPPYTWTLTSGQLPAGLSLSTNGTISGTPVLALSNPDIFTVQVTDSEVTPPTPPSQSFSITINPGTGNQNFLLNGQYTFLFKGFDANGPVAVAGSLTTDGNGNITAGAEDANRVASSVVQVVQAAALTGTYSIGTDGRGTMELIATNPSTGVPLVTDYNLVINSNGIARLIENNLINTTATSGLDTLGTHGEAILKPVNGTGSSSTFTGADFNGNYAFEFTGQDLSGKQAALAGTINANGSDLSVGGGGVNSDLNDNGTVSTQSVSGNFSTDMNSRGTATMLMEVGTSQVQLTFAFYFVSPGDLFFIEVDSPITTTLTQYYRLSGEMLLQQAGYQFVQSSSLLGSSVATGTGLSNSNASVLAGLLASSAAGTATFSYDEDNNGAIAGPSFSGTYSIAGNGRVVFTGLGSSGSATRLATAYLVGPDQGFLLGGDAAVTTGRLEQQIVSPATLADISGGYTLSSAFPGDTSVENIIGQLQASPSITVSIAGIIDAVDPPTTAHPEGFPHIKQNLSGNVNSLAANGRGTLATNAPINGVPTLLDFYIVSPGVIRAIPADATGDVHPQVFFFDH